MAKIKLDLDQDEVLTVTREVSIPTKTGKALKVKFDFIVRDRVAMGEFKQPRMEEAQEEMRRIRDLSRAAVEDGEDAIDLKKEAAEACARDATRILAMAKGWNVDLEFTAENLTKFCRRYPGAEAAVYEDYTTTMLQGRLGNL